MSAPLAPPFATIASASANPTLMPGVRCYTNHHRVTPPKSGGAAFGGGGSGARLMNQTAVVSTRKGHQQHHHHQKQSKKALSSCQQSSTSNASGSGSTMSRSKRRHQNKLKAKQQLQKKIQKKQQQQQQKLLLAGKGDDVVEQQEQQQQPTMTMGDGELRTPDAAADDEQRMMMMRRQQHKCEDDDDAMMIVTMKDEQQQHLERMDRIVDEMKSVAAGVQDAFLKGAEEMVEEIVMAPIPRKSNVDLFAELQEALALEPKFQPMLQLPQTSQDGEITIGARDGAAHVLRCLKVWYELPTDVLFAAVNLVDRFLAKMKVRPKHLACISVGSLYLAVEQRLMPTSVQIIDSNRMNTEDLVLISQCRCTAGDLERMASIIANKLGVQPNTSPVTPLTYIRIFYQLFRNAAYDLGLDDFYERSISLAELELRLEVLVCDATCSGIRAAELALVLICTQMDKHANAVVNGQISGLVDYAIKLQGLARIPDTSFFASHSTVVAILARYNNQHKMPYKQRLVWKLSSRTMRVLRPSAKLTIQLPTIDENNQVNFDSFSRFRTGSLSSEDDEDWPTSPIVPVFMKEEEDGEEIEVLC